jgi:FkbM family methyltransferase
MLEGRPAATVQTVKARHLHWTGTLILDHLTRRLMMRENGSAGSFAFGGDILTIYWDGYPPDTFVLSEGRFIDTRLSRTSSLPADWQARTTSVVVEFPGSRYTAELRLDESDIDSFQQIFVRQEFAVAGLPANARVIVDLGAYVGLSVLWFAQKFPGADLFALEPDPANFHQLQRNTLQLGGRARVASAAIWNDDRTLALKTRADDGSPMPGWASQTMISAPSAPYDGMSRVAAWSMRRLMQQFGIDFIDILKVDIEGAELDLFAATNLSWLAQVGMVIIETHDRFRPGSHAAVMRALSQQFALLPRTGKNHVFRRAT